MSSGYRSAPHRQTGPAAIMKIRLRVLAVSQGRRVELRNRGTQPSSTAQLAETAHTTLVRFAWGLGMSGFIYTFHIPESASDGFPATAAWRKRSEAFGWWRETGRYASILRPKRHGPRTVHLQYHVPKCRIKCRQIRVRPGGHPSYGEPRGPFRAKPAKH